MALSASTFDEPARSSQPSEEALPSYRTLPQDGRACTELEQHVVSDTTAATASERRDAHGLLADVKAAYALPAGSLPSSSQRPVSSSLAQTASPPTAPQDPSVSRPAPPSTSSLRSALRPTPSSISLRTLSAAPGRVSPNAAAVGSTIRKNHLRRVDLAGAHVDQHGSMMSVGTERFYTAHGPGMWEGREEDAAEEAQARAVEGADVLLRYFEDVAVDENPTLGTLRALAREPSTAQALPSLPADEDECTPAPLPSLAAFLQTLPLPTQPVEGAQITLDYLAAVYADVLAWLHPPLEDSALFVDQSYATPSSLDPLGVRPTSPASEQETA